MTKQTQTKPSRDMIWGEVMLCLEILAMYAGIEPMDIERFFRKPNETYSKYFINKLSKALCCINKHFSKQRSTVENKLHALIATMERDQFMSDEPLSAEAFFAYHRSDLQSLYFQASYVRYGEKNKEKEE